MKFNTDSHFVIGKYHIRQNKPCQDHALHGTKDNNGAGMICVSDGCSSGGHTDIGSRVITLSTIRALKDRNLRIPINKEVLPSFIADAIDTYSMVSRTALSITNNDMLATSIYAVVNETGGFIHMLGDGVCVVKYKDGDMLVTALNWEQNTPYYPIYREDMDRFIALHKQFNNGTQALKVHGFIIKAGADFAGFGSEEYVSIEEAVQGKVINIFDPANIECIAVFSDGIEDFQTSDKQPVELVKVIKEMMNFKNFTGEFVKRRVSAALKKYHIEGIAPNDDFSMAVIHFDNEQTQEL